MPKRHFTVDARAMLTLGRESIKDHTTAVLELVKNSYDAEAAVVEITVHATPIDTGDRFIRIADDGHGMNDSSVNENWLRIGFSAKRTEKLTPSKRRRKVGEKGIGRISADRLGSVLELKSQMSNDQAVGLVVNWDEFDCPGTDLDEINVDDLDETDFNVPRPSLYDRERREYLAAPAAQPNSDERSGTELTIRSLRQEWTVADVAELRRELETLTPPFMTAAGFQIRLVTDVEPEADGVIVSAFDAVAEIDAKFRYRQGRPIRITIRDRDAQGKQRNPETSQMKWEDFIHPTDTSSSRTSTSSVNVNAPQFGDVDVRLLFFPRMKDTVRGTTLSLTDLRSFLDVNEGIKIYRDNIRVLPYGDLQKPDGDWLGLADRKAQNPAGAGRIDYRINANQLVGAVLLTRDANPELVDTSGREGLVQGDAFHQLKQFLFGCVTHLENHYHEAFKKRREEQRPPPNPRDQVIELRNDLRDLATNLKEVGNSLPRGASRSVEKIRDQLADTQRLIEQSSKSLEDLASQTIIYRSLATLGIAAGTFGHETSASIDSLIMHTNVALSLLKRHPDRTGDILEQVEQAIRTAQQVSSWGTFALRRLNKDKRRRRRIEVHTIVDELVEEMRPLLASSNVSLTKQLTPVEGRGFGMDVESVVLNLITNAYYFAKQRSTGRAVSVRLRPRAYDGALGYELTVCDSGPGVPKHRQDRIWDPLFTTKVDAKGRPAGTGLGLSIIQSVVDDLGGKRDVVDDPGLGGAKFSVWLPLG